MEEYTYNRLLDQNGELNEFVVLRSDGLWIPTDPANSDYQKYLAWVSEGNQPEAIEA